MDHKVKFVSRHRLMWALGAILVLSLVTPSPFKTNEVNFWYLFIVAFGTAGIGILLTWHLINIPIGERIVLVIVFWPIAIFIGSIIAVPLLKILFIEDLSGDRYVPNIQTQVIVNLTLYFFWTITLWVIYGMYYFLLRKSPN
ncbi:MAG: hypothetical protein JSS79_04090 [Bacteroidetes bacterium]|nr:hypothetical protein [Bacteroidota bacterium]